MSGITGPGSEVTPLIGPQNTSETGGVNNPPPKGASPDTLSPAEQQDELNDLPIGALLLSWMPILQQPLFNNNSNDPGKVTASQFNLKMAMAEQSHKLIIGILDSWIEHIADEADANQKKASEQSRITSLAMDSILQLAALETLMKAEENKNSSQIQILMATLVASYAASVASLVAYTVNNDTFKQSLAINASRSVEEAHGSWSPATKEKYIDAVVAMSTLMISYTAMSMVLRAEADRAEAVDERKEEVKDSNAQAKEEAKDPENPTQSIQEVIANSKAILKACGMTDDELARIESNIDDRMDAAISEGGEIASMNSVFAYILMILESGKANHSPTPTAA